MQNKTVCFIFLLIFLFVSCEKKPSDPEFSNPLDPDNPVTGGDPFNLNITIADGGIRLDWSMPEFPSIKQFNVYRSEQENIGYALQNSVTKTVMTYLDTTVANGHTYWYRISVVDESDKESDYTNTAAIHINTEPVIVINGNAKYTGVRDVSLTILASNALQMIISNNPDFSGMVWETYTASRSWTVTAVDGEKVVFLKVRYNTDEESVVSSDKILFDTTPPIPLLVITPDSGITAETDFTFDPGNSTDNLCSREEMKIRFDWEDDGEFDTGWLDIGILNHSYTQGGGDKTVKMALKDAIGWQDSIYTNIFVNTRPSAAFTFDRDQLNFKLYHFDASKSSDIEDGTALEYRWDFENDGTWDTAYMSEDTASHFYQEAGEYTVTLSLRDQNSATDEASDQLTVQFFIDMVLVEGGTFIMGDTWGDGEPDELPTHQVTLSSFYLGVFEITEGQLETIIGLGVENGYNYPGAAWYDEMIDFCNHLSENEGLIPCYANDSTCNFQANGYRLPTEAEWEFAARGGVHSLGTKYSGSDTASLVGWMESTHPVGRKRSNELGLYDMTGNLHEVCWMPYEVYPAEPQVNPTGPFTRVVYRGGYYYGSGRVCDRWGDYYSRPPGGGTPHRTLGFRVVRKF